MIKIVATFNFKPGQIDKIMPIATELIETTRKEAGCLQYELVKSIKDENKMVMLETWESQETMTAHSNSEHFARLVPQLGELCTSPAEIDLYTPLI